MPDERLLEQIRSIERKPQRRGGDRRRRCIESVLSHLQRILNTRQGNVPIAHDYGIPDFLDFLQSFPESVHEVERNIKSAIDKFEPRLSGVTVLSQMKMRHWNCISRSLPAYPGRVVGRFFSRASSRRTAGFTCTRDKSIPEPIFR